MSSQTSIVTGVDFVTVPTQDLDRARDFYENVLGLEASSVWGSDQRPTVGAEFETGGVTLALLDTAKVGIDFRPSSTPIALRVDDVEAARSELESRGVTFVADTSTPASANQAFFKDPDGNSLGLHHRYAPAPKD